MLSLIKKDLKITLNKGNIGFYVIFILLAMFIFEEKSQAGSYVFITMIFTFALSSSSFAYDERSNTDYVINSLPVTRRDIVIAKYLSIAVSIVVTLFMTLIIFTLLNQLGRTSIEVFNLKLFLISSLFVIVMDSILFPLFFKFGYKKTNIIRVLVFMAFFVLTNVFFMEGNLEIPKSIHIFNDGALIFIWMALATIILLVSFMISIWLYTNKDL